MFYRQASTFQVDKLSNIAYLSGTRRRKRRRRRQVKVVFAPSALGAECDRAMQHHHGVAVAVVELVRAWIRRVPRVS